MLSSTDNNFMIFLFDFERFSIESRFPFFNSHYIGIGERKYQYVNQSCYVEEYLESDRTYLNMITSNYLFLHIHW